MNANPVPLQLQLPMKYFSSFSFGFGPGGASAARSWEAAKARAITRNVAVFIEVSPSEWLSYRSRHFSASPLVINPPHRSSLTAVETMPTLSDVQAQRLELNDPVLAPLIEAPDEAARERAFERILSSRD